MRQSQSEVDMKNKYNKPLCSYSVAARQRLYTKHYSSQSDEENIANYKADSIFRIKTKQLYKRSTTIPMLLRKRVQDRVMNDIFEQFLTTNREQIWKAISF